MNRGLKEKNLVNKATIFLMVLAVWTATARSARAQAELLQSGFINVDAGAQPQRQTITASASFPLYDEVATVTDVQRIRNGMVFDVSGGVRVASNLAAGVGFSQFGRSGTGTVTASIPSPRVFDQPLLVSRDADQLSHTERTIHGRITYFMSLTETFDVSVSGGPSYIHVVQGLATGLTVAPGTQSVSLGTATQSGNAFGVNGGIDANYMVQSSVGLGVWVRYTYGKLDLPDVKNFKVGGLQGGLGLRARF
jgi:hypothetical protein